MRPSEKLRQHLWEVRRLADKYWIRELRIFGSVARNEDTETSDIDLMAVYADEASILDHAAFTHAMRVLLQTDCDILSDEILDKSGFERMMQQSITLDAFENGQYTVQGAISKNERQSSGGDNLRWIMERISDTVGDMSYETFLSDPVRYDALAYQFQLLGSIAENAGSDHLNHLQQSTGLDFSGTSELMEMLMTTLYPKLVYQAARQICKCTRG